MIAEFCALTTFLQPLNNVLAICVCMMGGDGLNTTVTGGYGFETDGYGRGSGSLSVPLQFSIWQCLLFGSPNILTTTWKILCESKIFHHFRFGLVLYIIYFEHNSYGITFWLRFRLGFDLTICIKTSIKLRLSLYFQIKT